MKKIIIMVLALSWLMYPEQLSIIELKEWCFYYEFNSLDNYNETVPPSDMVFIDLKGGKADIYIKCSKSPTLPPTVPNSPLLGR